MAYANNITYLAMSAVHTYLLQDAFTSLAAASVLVGIDSGDLPVPRCVISCRDMQASDLIYSGMWNGDLDIVVTSQSDDSTGAEHHSLAGEVFARFMTASIAADLTAAITGFSVFKVVPRAQSWDIEGSTWKSKLTIGLLNACGSDIA